jgi:hypothetical protein
MLKIQKLSTTMTSWIFDTCKDIEDIVPCILGMPCGDLVHMIGCIVTKSHHIITRVAMITISRNK